MVVSDISLDHITRPEVVPTAFKNPREQLIYEAALAGPKFIRDNATVFSLLQSSIDKRTNKVAFPTSSLSNARRTGGLCGSPWYTTMVPVGSRRSVSKWRR